MKKHTHILVAGLIGLVLIITGCSQADNDSTTETGSQIEEAAVTAGSAFEQAKSEYVEAAKRTLADWTKKVGDLEVKTGALPDLAQKPLEAPMSQLLEKRDEVKGKFETVADAGEDTFEAEKAALEESIGELNQAYNNVTSLLN